MRPKKKYAARQVTMNDVAKLAGVSQTTVSFVINNVQSAGIPDVTKERILAAIAELGYRPNQFAKNLRMQQSNLIGFVTDQIATSPHAGEIIQGAQDAASAAGKILFLANTSGNPETERAEIDTMLVHQVQGLVYATMYHRPVAFPPHFDEVPSVLLDCFVEDGSLPSVVPDEVTSAVIATNVLLQQGHRRIAFINSTAKTPAANGRFEGYKSAMTGYNISLNDDLICRGESDANNGYENAKRLLALPSPPTAIFCFNDQVAMGVYEAFCESRIRIPSDVAVIGFDNLEIIAAYLRPALSTMELPHYQMGQWAVKYLLEHLDGQDETPPPQHKIVCRYIERASA